MSEELIWEMFREAGPVVSVNIPKDRVTDEHQGRVGARSLGTGGGSPSFLLVCLTVIHSPYLGPGRVLRRAAAAAAAQQPAPTVLMAPGILIVPSVPSILMVPIVLIVTQ